METVTEDSSAPQFEDIYMRAKEKLWAFVRGKGFTQEDADDILQEACYRAFRTQKNEVRHEGYLFQVVANLINEIIRNRYRTKKKLEKYALDLAGNYSPELPDQLLARRQIQARVRATVEEKLHDGEGRISPNILAVQMFHLEERPVAECAEALGATSASVKAKVHRGRKSLKTQLANAIRA